MSKFSLIKKIKKLKGKLKISPLLVAAIAVAAIPIIISILSTQQNIGSQPRAGVVNLNCGSDECNFKNKCRLKGFSVTLNLNKVTYTCLGANKWRTNNNDVIQVDVLGNIPVSVVVTSRPSPRPTTTAQDKKGCVISLRYDKNDKVDTSLKREASAKIKEITESIRQAISSGQTAQQFIRNLRMGESPEQRRQRMQKIKQYYKLRSEKPNSPLLQQLLPTIAANPLAKFQMETSVNFCFANSTERNNRIDQSFMEINPVFNSTISPLNSGQVSEPFILKRKTPSSIIDIDYAIAIIALDK